VDIRIGCFLASVIAGVMDSDEGVPSPELHVWTRSKESWAPMLDELPQHETNP